MSERGNGDFFGLALGNLRRVWQGLAAVVGQDGDWMPAADLPLADANRVEGRLRECLAARGGEASARARAARLGEIYLALDTTGRARFLDILARRFDVDHAAVHAAARVVTETGADSGEALIRAEAELRATLEAPRRRLLAQFTALPDGVKLLVDMRAELRRLRRSAPELAGLERDLRALLAAWFAPGFLELRRITWEAPAALLERLVASEAVHEIRSWRDLKNRLDSDRRFYAFFHPRMPDEPLIFVEVALVEGMAGNIQGLLDVNAPILDPQTADTAIFYSISNAQAGLAGINFGGFLIKRVVDALAAEFRNLRRFATLSPMPGFRDWVEQYLDRGAGGVPESERAALAAALGGDMREAADPLRLLLDRPDWPAEPGLAAAARRPLLRLGARYLVEEKREGGHALDPVAHFHLSNGARVERLNWLADTSETGLARSCGLMVNYLYDLDRIEDNHEAYVSGGRTPSSSSLRDLLRD